MLNRVLGPTKLAMLVTDIGFLVYWAIAFAQIIPPELAYKDYANPILSDWNFSFVVLDLAASATGLASLCRTNGTPGARFLGAARRFQSHLVDPQSVPAAVPAPALIALTCNAIPNPAE